jgi:hypothetical protein
MAWRQDQEQEVALTLRSRSRVVCGGGRISPRTPCPPRIVHLLGGSACTWNAVRAGGVTSITEVLERQVSAGGVITEVLERQVSADHCNVQMNREFLHVAKRVVCCVCAACVCVLTSTRGDQ